MALTPLNWATSKTVGGITEIAVMAPIKKGRIPGERRTYEERLRFVISTTQRRVERGIPTQLSRVPTIHFGRMIIIRPEQYLVYSANVKGVSYHSSPELSAGPPRKQGNIPDPIDDYNDGLRTTAPEDAPEFRSWLLTLVSFDGDLKVYFKDVATFLNTDFDNVFRNCDDFPGTGRFEAFWLWIRRYQINVDLFYPRYPELSVVRIKQLEEFKRRFDLFVAKVRSPTGKRVESMDELFDEFLRTSQQHASNFPAPGGTFETGKG